MITKYICEIDGKEFEDGEACAEYEGELVREVGKDIILGTDNFGTPIPYTNTDFCREVIILCLKNDEAVKLFCGRCENERFPYDNIEGPGVYVWDEGRWGDGCEFCDWNKVEGVIAYYQRMADELKEYAAKFEKE